MRLSLRSSHRSNPSPRRVNGVLIGLCLIFLSSACGFQPVHSEGPYIAGSSGSISIPEIEGRQGHMLRRALLDQLAPGLPGVESGVLTATLGESINRLTTRRDGSASRTSIRANAQYTLTYGKVSLTGKQSVETNFNVTPSAFGDVAAQTAARDRLMLSLAEKILNDLKIQLIREQEQSKDTEAEENANAPSAAPSDPRDETILTVPGMAQKE